MARQLRLRTALSHERVEADLDLLDPQLTPARLGLVIQRFYGFWRGNETVLDSWAQANPQAAARLDWDRRRRQAHLRADLLALGRALGNDPDALPVAAPVSAVLDQAAVFGWLYVSEGSTLGGAVLDRRLRPLLADLGVTLRSFTPYDEGPGPMWQAYQRRLEDWVGADQGRATAVGDAAAATFDALLSWLAPLHDEVAA